MENDLQRAVEQLRAWVGTPIAIQKEEDGDLDTVELELKDVRIGSNPLPDRDGYVSQFAILLQGPGSVGSSGKAHLPQNVYEIPVTHRFDLLEASPRLHIATERARYLLVPKS